MMEINQKSKIKNQKLMKAGFFAATFALLAVGAHAQTTPMLPSTPAPPIADSYWTEFTATGEVESIDTVTVGSRMPYKVEALTGVPATLTVQYKWLFSPAIAIQSLSSTPTGLTGENDYYTENEISVLMPSSPTTAGSPITLYSNARYKSGSTVLCTNTDAEYKVVVVPRPKIEWTTGPTTAYGCVGSNIAIPNAKATGYKQFEVEYSMVYYTKFDKSDTPTTLAKAWVVLAGDELIFPAAAFTNAGLYEITITNITDRISRKSLDMNLVKAQTVDLPTGAYTVMILDLPKTKPLQHIKNMP